MTEYIDNFRSRCNIASTTNKKSKNVYRPTMAKFVVVYLRSRLKSEKHMMPTCVLKSALPTVPDLTFENCILPPASETLNAGNMTQ